VWIGLCWKCMKITRERERERESQSRVEDLLGNRKQQGIQNQIFAIYRHSYWIILRVVMWRQTFLSFLYFRISLNRNEFHWFFFQINQIRENEQRIGWEEKEFSSFSLWIQFQKYFSSIFLRFLYFSLIFYHPLRSLE
jgi:hypothetical protein